MVVASLPGQSRRWSMFVEELNSALAASDRVVLVGEPGSGKRHIARALTTATALEVDCASRADTLDLLRSRDRVPRPLVVTHLERLSDAALAEVEQKRAALEQAQLDLQYTKIVAPVGGEVNKSVVVGLNVQQGQQLLTIVPLDEVWITANFKETQLRRMRAGQKAEIHVDSSGRTFKGHVDSIAGATGPLFSLLPPENATGNYVKIVQRIPVKIVLDPGENGEHQLRPGMNVVPDVYLQ